jgi:hypothetical protein
MSVRITAAGAVAVVCLSFLTAPVSACDERYIKKCERASAAQAAAAQADVAAAPVARRKSARRVQLLAARHSRHVRLGRRSHAPEFARRGRAATLASAESRMTVLPHESALARRFRGFISPQPLAQNAFEAWRKPHLVAVNLEPPVAPAEAAAAAAASDPPAAAAAPAAAVTATIDAPLAPAATMELASAESKAVALPEPPAVAAPRVAPNPAPAAAAPQAFVSETPPLSPTAPPRGFSIHQLVLALCGALGAASALRLIVGA